MPAWKFSLLNLLAAFVWAATLLIVIGWLGPAWLGRYGFGGWAGALIMGAIVLAVFKIVGTVERRALDTRPPA